MNWFVALCPLVIKMYFFQTKLVEQPTQALLLDASGKSAAAHHPIVDFANCSLDAAKQNRNFTERAIFVFVTDRHQKSSWVVKIRGPGTLVQSPSVEIELIGLVNKLDGAMVISLFPESEGHDGLRILKEAIERIGIAIRRAGQNCRCANALQAEGILFGYDRLSKEISQLAQELPERLRVALRENQTFHLRESGFDFGKLHRAIVDENNRVSRDVPSFQDAADRFGFWTPVNVDWIQRLLSDQQVFSCKGLFHQRRVILAGNGSQHAGARQGGDELLVEPVNVRLLIEMPRDSVNAVFPQDSRP